MSTGPQGVQGLQGIQGNQGIAGPTGMQGPQGLQGPGGGGGGGGAAGSLVTISSYTGMAIANTVTSNTSSITYVWSNAIPTEAKGHAGTLAVFFNLTCASGFQANQAFEYGLYIDGTSLAYGDANTCRYVQSSLSTYAVSSNGYPMGTGGPTAFLPLSIPLYVPPAASLLQIGFANSSFTLSPVSSISPGYTSNILTSTNTSNTSNYIPQNTFTTTGATTYTVPTTVSTGSVSGVYIYCWGAGGGLYSTAAGGGGGFVSGFYSCTGGTVLNLIVGSVGTSSGGGTVNSVTVGGAGNGQLGGGGGGFSGVFLTSATPVQSNAIAIAGGGAGGGFQGQNNGGAGGYPTGSAPFTVGASPAGIIRGGTQTAGGANSGASGTSPGIALQGGASVNGGGGAGGGWYGGGGAGNGISPSPAYEGAGGGSSFVGSILGASPSPSGIGLTSGAATSNGVTASTSGTSGSNAFPGGNTNQFYTSAKGVGNGSSGLVVIVPAVGVSATNIGVNAKMLVT